MRSSGSCESTIRPMARAASTASRSGGSVARAEVDRPPRRQPQLRGAGRFGQRRQTVQLFGFEPTEGRRHGGGGSDDPERASRLRQRTTGHGRSSGARTDLTCATPAAERPRMRVRVAPPAAARNARTAASAAAAAASGDVAPSHCVPDGVSMPSAISAPTASSATSARSAAMETVPPPSISRPNFAGNARSRSSAARAVGNGPRDGAHVERLGGIEARQGRDHEIARRLGLGIGIDQAELAELGVQLGQVLVQKAAQLQVGAPREIDMAVAQPPGEVGQAARLLEAEGAAERPDAHDQPVAAQHRAQGARAPAFHLGGGGRVHDPAFRIARSSS